MPKESHVVMSTVKRFYEMTPLLEWSRLVKDPYHKQELTATMSFLRQYLPKKGLILDAGSGPGRYSIALAKRGYNMVLLDISKSSLELAAKKSRTAHVSRKIKGMIQGSITELSMFKDNSFDAVLCLGGVLCHVYEEKNRYKAVAELVRVAKPGAPIFVSVMGRIGTILTNVERSPREVNTKNFKSIVLHGEDKKWHGKYYSHLFFPNELLRYFERPDVRVLEFAGLEGIGINKAWVNKLAKMGKSTWKNWTEAQRKLSTHPVVAGMSPHMLIVCRKL